METKFFLMIAALPGLSADAPPKQELLVETDWLEARLKEPGIRIVDLRAEKSYGEGHIPGAVRIDEGILRDPSEEDSYLPKPEKLAAVLGKAGISNESHVVAYDAEGGRAAARLWYVLAALGHDRASILNGGWTKWSAEKRPASVQAPEIAVAKFTPKPVMALSCPASELKSSSKDRIILDTRTKGEFEGSQTSKGFARAGHIPGAVHVDWTENVTGPQKVFKALPELRKLYESKGVTPDKEIVTYCATGGRASHTFFALKLLGYPKVRIYYGSFGDWSSRADLPVEK